MELALPFTPEAAASGGVGLAMLFWLWREVRKARSEDKRDDAEGKIRDDLIKMNADLVARADRMAGERNDEREKRIRAEAEVERLNAHIADLAQRCRSDKSCGIRVEAQRTD